MKKAQPIQGYCNDKIDNNDNSNNGDNDNNNNDNDDDNNNDNNNNQGGGDDDGDGVDGDGDDGDGGGDNDCDNNNNDNGDLQYANLSRLGLLKVRSQSVSVYSMVWMAVTYHYENEPLWKLVLSFIFKLSTTLAVFGLLGILVHTTGAAYVFRRQGGCERSCLSVGRSFRCGS